MPDEKVPSQVGPYRILEEIGQGGMGTVYLAEQREPVRRRVALKVIKLGMDTKEVLSRFHAERQALAMMEHGNIARVFDAGATEGGRPYFAMEYVKGEPITEYCDRNKLSLEARLELFQQVCSGIQHAHTKGVIHRDVKPTNVLVTVVDGQPRVKIIDFGLARATDHRLIAATLFTEQGRILGTPEYMSPEQAGLGSIDIDTRTDVYSLGVLLYELLTGTLPFTSDALRKAGLFEVHRMIREEEPPRPSTRLSTLRMEREQIAAQRHTSVPALLRQLRTDLDWVVMKSIEKDRTRRYETASEFAADIARFLRGEAVVACPPSFGYRVRKFARRYRGQVLAAALLLGAILAGIAGTAWFAIESAANAERATSAAALAEQRAVDNGRLFETANRDRIAADEARRTAEQALTDFQAEQRRKEQLQRQLEEQQRRERLEQAREALRSREDLENARRASDTFEVELKDALTAIQRQMGWFGESGVAAVPSRDAWRAWADAGALSHRDPASALAVLDAALAEPAKEWTGLQRAMLCWAKAECHVAIGDLLAANGAYADARRHLDLRRDHLDQQAQDDRPGRVREPDALRGSLALRWADATVRGDLDWLDGGTDAAPAAAKAMQRRRRGDLAAALALARSSRADGDAVAVHASMLEAGRALLVSHRPGAASRVAEQDRRALAAASGQGIREAEALELGARAAAALGRWDAALTAVERARGLLPVPEVPFAQQLRWLHGEILLRLGRPDEALATWTGVAADALQDVAGLPVDLLGVASAAARAGRPGLVERALSAVADEDPRIRAEVMLLRAAHRDILSPDPDANRERWAALVPRLEDPWLRARCRVACASIDGSTPRAVLRSLELAAADAGAWLTDHARFRGDPDQRLPVDSEVLAADAIAALITLAPGFDAHDAAAAFFVLETFRALPIRVALTRPASFVSRGVAARTVARYAAAREQALDGGPWDREGSERLGPTMRLLEQQMREQAPAYASAVLPRVPAVGGLAEVLPEATALVVFAESRGSAVALLATRSRSRVVPLPLAVGLAGEADRLGRTPDDGAAAVHDRLGTMLLDPVMAALGEERIETLLLAPSGVLCAIPFECCTIATQAGRQRLMASHDVVYVPSGTACFDQLRDGAEGRSVGRGALALAAGDDGGSGARPWLRAFLGGFVAAPELERLDALGDPAFTSHRGATLRLVAGTDANDADFARVAGDVRAIGLSLPLELMPAREHGALRCAPGDELGSDGMITAQDLRDLATCADVALVRNERRVDPAAEAETMCGFVAAAWSGGVRAVVTVANRADPRGAGAIRAFVAARFQSADGIAAWNAAMRAELAKGDLPAAGFGVRLWCVRS